MSRKTKLHFHTYTKNVMYKSKVCIRCVCDTHTLCTHGHSATYTDIHINTHKLCIYMCVCHVSWCIDFLSFFIFRHRSRSLYPAIMQERKLHCQHLQPDRMLFSFSLNLSWHTHNWHHFNAPFEVSFDFLKH